MGCGGVFACHISAGDGMRHGIRAFYRARPVPKSVDKSMPRIDASGAGRRHFESIAILPHFGVQGLRKKEWSGLGPLHTWLDDKVHGAREPITQRAVPAAPLNAPATRVLGCPGGQAEILRVI